MKRWSEIIACICSALLLSAAQTACAQQQTPETPIYYSGSILSGYHHYTVDDSRVKLGEYEVLDSGFETYFTADAKRSNTKFHVSGEILDEDDQTYLFSFDIGRLVHSNISYNRFRHNLDHDPMVNQDTVFDYSPGDTAGLTIEELRAENSFRIPGVDFLKIHADFRSYAKRGHRQATTVSKCNQCHVSSKNKRINTRTRDTALGLEAVYGPATIHYEYTRRSFHEDGSPPRINYGEGSSLFLVTGYADYSRVPDSTTDIHTLTFRTRLPLTTELYASYQFGERKNKDTRNSIEFDSISARLSKYFARYLSCDLFYYSYSMDNDVPDGYEVDRERGGFDINLHLFKKTGIKGTFIWEDIDRDQFTERSSDKKVYRLTLNNRLLTNLRLHARLEKIKIDDPFISMDPNYPRLVLTSQPEDENTAYISFNWSVRHNLSLNGSARCTSRENSRFDVDEDRCEISLGIWAAPFERFTFSATYSFIETDIDTTVVFKTYHDRDLSSYILYDEIPYNDRSHSWFITASYQISPRISLSGDFSYILSDADYDVELDGRNIGQDTDISISRIESSIGLTYLFSRRISFYTSYMYREYDDHEQEWLAGSLHYFGVGVGWSF